MFNAQGTFLRKFGSEGANPVQFIRPAGIAVAGDGTVIVCDQGNHRIQQLKADGSFVRTIGSRGRGQGQGLPLKEPYALWVSVNGDGTSRMFVGDSNCHVQVVAL